MNKKKLIIIIGLTGLFVILSFTLYFILFSFKHIEDTDGSITELETIELIDMVNAKDKYKANNNRLQYSGSTTGVEEARNNNDYDFIEFRSSKLSGIKTIQTTNIEENQRLIIEIENELSKGNLKIIIVSPDHSIVETIEPNTNQIIEIDNTITGYYRVVVGAESADVTIRINRTIRSY